MSPIVSPLEQAVQKPAARAISSQTSGKAVKKTKRPRVLIVTPEMNGSGFLNRHGYYAPRAKAGGLADVSTLLFDALAERGADVHVAMPHFRSLFTGSDKTLSRRFHLCPDREFFYRKLVYEGDAAANLRASLAFQRDVIHQVIPRLKPDIVHCHDWMTALVPAAARGMGIRSVFTIHNLHDERTTLAHIEDRGMDAGRFWQHLHYERYPTNYEETRSGNSVRFMASAIHAADEVTTVSPGFLHEIMEGRHPAGEGMIGCLRAKYAVGRAAGILNALVADFHPASDYHIAQPYSWENHRAAKAENKLVLQKALGLEQDAAAPVFFWPSRLDPVQKGCHLLAEILYQVVSGYWKDKLQVVFIADGPYRRVFEGIADFHGLRSRIAVHGFSEDLSRQAYAGSDFLLVPSGYEPCGLAQMVGLRYGSLPVAHRTGGLRDTIRHLEPDRGTGNGFLFEDHNSEGLRWAIDEAMRFYQLPGTTREREIGRAMRDSERDFAPAPTIQRYLEIYERLAGRPV